MISVETREYNTNGVADLSEAVELARTQGIANARGAINEDVLWPLYSLGSMVGMGMLDMIPGIKETSSVGGINVSRLVANEAPDLLRELLQNTEKSIQQAAGKQLPNWNPTSSITGSRMVTMFDGANFRTHADIYEGLVASIQLTVDGTKNMRAQAGDQWENTDIQTGDITLFAGDTFSEYSRRMHGFTFAGHYAVAFTLGQDPMYTISGNLPLLQENPQYVALLRTTRDL